MYIFQIKFQEIYITQKIVNLQNEDVTSKTEAIEDGEELNITATLKNEENEEVVLTVMYNLDSAFEVNNATLVTEDGQRKNLGQNQNYILVEYLKIPANGTTNILINAKINANKATQNTATSEVKYLENGTFTEDYSKITLKINKK